MRHIHLLQTHPREALTWCCQCLRQTDICAGFRQLHQRRQQSRMHFSTLECAARLFQVLEFCSFFWDFGLHSPLPLFSIHSFPHLQSRTSLSNTPSAAQSTRSRVNSKNPKSRASSALNSIPVPGTPTRILSPNHPSFLISICNPGFPTRVIFSLSQSCVLFCFLPEFCSALFFQMTQSVFLVVLLWIRIPTFTFLDFQFRCTDFALRKCQKENFFNPILTS